MTPPLMTFSRIGCNPQRRKHSISCSSAFFRFLPSAVGFLRPVEDRRKIPFPEIRLRFQNREGHAKTARGIGKMKILYYTAPLCARKGQPHFLNRNRAFFGGYRLFWSREKTVQQISCFIGRPNTVSLSMRGKKQSR